MTIKESTFLLIFLAITQIGISQIKVGGTVGLSMGNLLEHGDENIYSKDFKSISRYEFGIYTEYAFKNNFSLKLEVLSANKGGRREGIQPIPVQGLIDNPNFDLNTLSQIAVNSGGAPIRDTTPLYANFVRESRFDYIDIPLLLKYSFGKEKKLFVEFGPYIGFMLKATQITMGSSQFYANSAGTLPLQIPNPSGTPAFFPLPTESFNATTDVIDDVEATNYGIQFGLGVSREYNNKHEISFGLRASYGFVPIQKDETFGQNRIGSLSINISYAYIFSKKTNNI